MNDPLHWLRRASLAEGVSWLLLLGVGMPLKYRWDVPLAVTVFGMLHGVLFVALCWLLLRAHMGRGWQWRRLLLIFAAAFVPAWPFLLDRRMRDWIAATPR